MSKFLMDLTAIEKTHFSRMQFTPGGIFARGWDIWTRPFRIMLPPRRFVGEISIRIATNKRLCRPSYESKYDAYNSLYQQRKPNHRTRLELARALINRAQFSNAADAITDLEEALQHSRQLVSEGHERVSEELKPAERQLAVRKSARPATN